ISLNVATAVTTTFISQIQGSGGTSPLVTQTVTTRGIVTAKRSNGFFIQSRPGDEDGSPETSEGLFVFTGAAPATNVGDDVSVMGTVQEFIPAADPTQLPVTEL